MVAANGPGQGSAWTVRRDRRAGAAGQTLLHRFGGDRRRAADYVPCLAH